MTIRDRRRSPRSALPVLGAGVLALLAAGCGTGLIPGDPAGTREWTIAVDNQTAQPARLMVAEDTMPVGNLVGTAVPSVVPPNTEQDVVFTVPPGQTWAIFVNPSAQIGPLILAMDVPPDAEGELPIWIVVTPGGPSVALGEEAGPGWFGN